MSENKNEFRVMKGHVFRKHNPAVFGAEIISGTLRQHDKVFNSKGEKIGVINQIAKDGIILTEIKNDNALVVILMEEPIIGVDMEEGEICSSFPAS